RRLALDALNQLVFGVQEDLRNAPGTHKLRRKLLQQALDGLERVVGEAAGADPDHTTAAALIRLGCIFLEMGDVASASRRFERARDVAERLVQANPADEEALHSLAEAYLGLGEGAAREGRFKDARALLCRGLQATEPGARTTGNPRVSESVLK